MVPLVAIETHEVVRIRHPRDGYGYGPVPVTNSGGENFPATSSRRGAHMIHDSASKTAAELEYQVGELLFAIFTSDDGPGYQVRDRRPPDFEGKGRSRPTVH